jgi:nucleotide-binding universal stress UspA family protein
VIRYVAHPAEGLALYLAEHPAQLVVVTTHARRGLTRSLFGSVASRIVHEVSAPVLLLGPLAVGTDPEVTIPWPHSPFETVIVPVDVADPSAPELRMAQSFAKKSQANLVLVHVTSETDVSDRWRAMTDLADRLRPLRAAFIDGSDVSDAVLALTGLLGQQWDLPVSVLEVVAPQARPGGNSDVIQDSFVHRSAAKLCERYGVHAAAATVDGAHVADAIADWAAEHPESIIVLGSHGSGVSEERMGSVVMEVAHKSTVPVLVFPAYAAARQWQRFVAPADPHVKSGHQ